MEIVGGGMKPGRWGRAQGIPPWDVEYSCVTYCPGHIPNVKR